MRKIIKRNGMVYPCANTDYQPRAGCPIVLQMYEPNAGGWYNHNSFSLALPEARAFYEELGRKLAEAELIEATKGIADP